MSTPAPSVSTAISTSDRIEQRLRAVLAPLELTLEDDSAQHAGHAGARGGGGHFNVRIVAQQFAGLPVIARHRMVYDALADLMQHEIHALAIVALSPADVRS